MGYRGIGQRIQLRGNLRYRNLWPQNPVFPFRVLTPNFFVLNNIYEAFPRAPRDDLERGASFLAYFSQEAGWNWRLQDRGWKSRIPVLFPSVLGLG